MMHKRQREEILETIFTEREQKRDDAESILAHTFGGHAPDVTLADFHELEGQGLVHLTGNTVALSPEGEDEAKKIVRRHRLAERLFTDLLDLGEGEVESHACEFEHILSKEATDSVCTLLGHPPTCPHGKAIPPGPCCGVYQKTVNSLVTRLPNLPLGATARIVFIAPRFHDRMDRLAALGVIPGCDIRLHQRLPAYVIAVGETTIGLDPEIASEIFVKPIGES